MEPKPTGQGSFLLTLKKIIMGKTQILIEIDHKSEDKLSPLIITSVCRTIKVDGKLMYADNMTPQMMRIDDSPINLLCNWLEGKEYFADNFLRKYQDDFSSKLVKALQEAAQENWLSESPNLTHNSSESLAFEPEKD
jgi:hypothetical protein